MFLSQPLPGVRKEDGNEMKKYGEFENDGLDCLPYHSPLLLLFEYGGSGGGTWCTTGQRGAVSGKLSLEASFLGLALLNYHLCIWSCLQGSQGGGYVPFDPHRNMD